MLSNYLPGQAGLSPTEAKQLVLALYEREILSEEGRLDALELIANKDEKAFPRYLAYLEPPEDRILKSSLFSLLYRNFHAELYYRLAFYARLELQDSEADEATKKEERMQLLASHPGILTEMAITAEDLVTLKGWVAYPPLTDPNHPGGLIHPNRSAVGKHRTKTANDLLEIGLITPNDHAVILDRITSNDIDSEAALMGYLMQTTFVRDRVQVERDRKIEAIDQLIQANLIDVNRREELINRYGNFELTAPADFLPYLVDPLLILERNAFPPYTKAATPQIFQQLYARLPSIQLTELTVEVFTKFNELGDKNSYDVQLTGTHAGQTYTKTYYGSYQTKTSFDSAGDIDFRLTEGIFTIHNQILLEAAASERLYFVAAEKEKAEVTKAYVLQLDRNEAKLLQQLFPDERFLLGPAPSSIYDQERIETTIKELQALALLPTDYQLSADPSTKTCLSNGNIESYLEILPCLSTLFLTHSPDHGSKFKSYPELITALSIISRGYFEPSKVQLLDSNERETIISFTLNDVTFRETLRKFDGYIDSKLIQKINEALASNNESQVKLYGVGSSGNQLGFLFLTPKQRTWLRAQAPYIYTH